MNFGERLRNLRVSSGLTHREISEKTGISSGNFSKYESGKVKPSVEVLALLCQLFNVSADWFLFGEEPTIKKAKVFNNPDLEFAIQLLTDLYNDPNPDMRGWAKIQFKNAFEAEIDKKNQEHISTIA